MQDQVRSGPPLADEDIHVTNVPESFRAFAEEVRRRGQKPKATPLSIAQKLQPAEFNTALVHFYRGEVRRYRYYEVWANRVRVLETGYLAPMLSHRTIPPDKEWAEHISSDLISPH